MGMAASNEDPDSEAIDVAYAESTTTLQTQKSDVDGARNRASFVLAAAGISGGTILGQTNEVSGFGLIAVIGFLAAAVLAVWVLMPTGAHWEFKNLADDVLAKVDEGWDATPVKRWLAEENAKHYQDNHKKVTGLYFKFKLAALSLAFAILCVLLNVLVT
jgi:hypothetical protein